MKKYFNFDTTYDRLDDVLYTYTNPTRVKEPKLILFNDELSESLGLDINLQNKEDFSSLEKLLSGNAIQEDSKPLAQAYAGHQFGYFTMLGDGRAILLGEHISPDGNRVDIQLKGAGRTKYSRNGDGRASISPVLREYLISEAMYKLGISTTRSLAVCTTGEDVIREKRLDGAVLTRVAKTHIRFGTFQFASIQKDKNILKDLADYIIYRYYKNVANLDNKYLELFRAIYAKQAKLISEWFRVGFIHGVMNTDNMSIFGETIDYGPCAFMNKYNPDTVFSSIDTMGRYRFSQQSTIGAWNVARLAESFIPLFDEEKNRDKLIDELSLEVNKFVHLFKKEWTLMMAKKLGFTKPNPKDISLIERLLGLMYVGGFDYNNTFIYLRHLLTPLKFDATSLMPKDFNKLKQFDDWIDDWKNTLKLKKISYEEAIKLMEKNNPIVIPRNHKVEEALTNSINGDLTKFKNFLDILKQPYNYNFTDTSYMLVSDGDNHYVTYCGT